MTQKERFHAIKTCRYVDEVIEFPWVPTKQWLVERDIDFIVHDAAPYEVPGMGDCYADMKSSGMFLPSLRTSGVSTTDLITRVLKRKVSCPWLTLFLGSLHPEKLEERHEEGRPQYWIG